jgi:hypothetical protein
MKYRFLFAVAAILLLTQPAASQSVTSGRLGDAASRSPVLPVGEADLNCSFLEFTVAPATAPAPGGSPMDDRKARTGDMLPDTPHAMLTARIQGAGPTGFRLFSQPGDGRRLDPFEWSLVGRAPTNAAGQGELRFPVPLPDNLPANTEIAFVAVYRDFNGRPFVSEVAPFVFNPMPRGVLALERDMTGARIPAGVQLREQWRDVGVHIRAANATPGHPDKAIVYDSSDFFGQDPDLVTPGYGPFNERAYQNLMIIAENDVDLNGDACVDQPDDEANGGIITFEFDEPTRLFEIVLIDIDEDETVTMRGFHGNHLVQDLAIAGAGDNSLECIGFAADKVTRLEVELDGSGAIGQLSVHGLLDRTRTTPRDDSGHEYAPRP